MSQMNKTTISVWLVTLLVLHEVSLFHCFGSLSVTYAGDSCNTGDPTSVSYIESNSATCAGLSSNCSTTTTATSKTSVVQTCQNDPGSALAATKATTLYFGASTYNDKTCGATSNSTYSQLASIRYQRLTSGFLCYLISSGVSYRQLCAKDGTLTLVSCTDEACGSRGGSCSSNILNPTSCISTTTGSSKFSCTACPACSSAGGKELSLLVITLLLMFQLFMFL